ncbi:dienelactone hydrolase family protein [Streptomyces sp. DSM 44917]|uniref:Dienelactone hydrolase family protein n=1 Tax=Streptomyces boetiae TaxID=3075541 RepID=A0ABU2L619_9ACTN|nr:dienelactone hydrolase family protein [Streptomyces sp. DSM 44917]MDT0306896.1 dienelactone hydrolase family protein [Streptomyces sp. DSM 44917]
MPKPTKTWRGKLALSALAISLAGGTLLGIAAAPGSAGETTSRQSAGTTANTLVDEQEYRRGPAPTAQSVIADRGPFAFRQESVPAGSGFAGGTVYYPTDTSQGTFGAIAFSPGFLENQSAVSWYGPRLASNGFVVVTINTNSGFDAPDQRADQLMAALEWLTTRSSVRTRVDPNRLAVAGHSMGGGGALSAVSENPELRAAISLTPWHTDNAWSEVTVPTLIVGAERDWIAPVRSHAEPFYQSLTGARERAYLEMNNANHFVTNRSNETIGRTVLAWAKRYVDNDSRYEQFLCPAPQAGGPIEEYRSSC